MTAQPDYLQQSKDRQAAYDRMYPDHCPWCQGVGVVVSPAHNEVPEDVDVCACFEAGRCPRCGHRHTAAWMEANAEYEVWPYPCDWCGFTGIEPGRPQLDPYYDAEPVLSGSGYDAETPMYGLPYAGGGYCDD